MTYSLYHIGLNADLNSGYVGITTNPDLRFSQHGWLRKKSNKHLQNALRKYGDQVLKRVIVKDLDQEAAALIEEMLRPYPNIGWNIAPGGGIPPNPKGKERSHEYRQNISKSKVGEKNPMFGKKLVFSDQHKQRLSKALIGRPSKLKGVARPKVQCPHCGKVGSAGGMYTWHFDRCRYVNQQKST